MVGDVGVNATMTPEVLANVAVGTCAVARDLFPEDVLPTDQRRHGLLLQQGIGRGPQPGTGAPGQPTWCPEILADRIKRGQRYATHQHRGRGQDQRGDLAAAAAHLYRKGQENAFVGGTNVIIVPNLDTGNLLFHLYATRYPDAKKFSVMFGIRFQGVDLPMDSTAEDAVLGVKACVLRLHRFKHWSRTPKDTFFPRHRILAINPGSTSTKIAVYEGELERFTEEIQHSAAELEPFEGQRIVEQYGMRKDVILSDPGRPRHRRGGPGRRLRPRRPAAAHPPRHLPRERPHAGRPAGRHRQPTTPRTWAP